ncbi:MAG: PAS domain S-box protein [Sandaracinaceae bacterium]|nr:PAS domain S-box protein [Sandaracinaceae bacterium]
MTWDLHGDDALRGAIAEAIGDVELPWRVLVVDVAHPEAAARSHEAKERGEAVLAIAHDDDGAADALEAGANVVVRWPASARTLRLSLLRAAEHARVPWLARLFEMVTDSVEITDSDTSLLDVNPAFERITGYSRDSAIGHTPASLFRTANQDETHYEGIGETIGRGDVWRGQFTARRQDGSLSFQAVAIAAAYDPERRVVGHIALKRDTTRDDLAWNALENAESRTRVVLERAAEAVLVHDIHGAIVDLNPAACRMLDVPRERLLEAPIHTLAVDRDPEAMRQLYEGLGADPLEDVEARWRCGDEGPIVDVALSLARTRISGTKLYITIARDVTLRREAERKLKSLNDELEKKVASRTRELRRALAQRGAVLDHLSDGIVSVDARGRMELWNPAFAMLLGGVPASRLGSPLQSIYPPLAEVIRECLAEERSVARELSLPDGRIAEAAATPIFVEELSASRLTLGAVMLVRDVTRAREVDRMKTDFIATVSHELRTPLTSVLGFAKLAQKNLRTRVAPALEGAEPRAASAFATVEKNLDIIAREGARLSELIDDVLDISKMEAGRMEWARERIDPVALVDEAIEVTSGLFSNGPVECARDVTPLSFVIEGDRQRLLQVVINLISNAAKFTERGVVTLGVAPHAEGVCFTVTDTGIGVPADQRDAIFEKFKQARDTLTDKPRGTGLGLPICRHIVEHHGGRIWIEDGPAGGSRFAFVIPASGRVGVDADTARELASHIGGALVEQRRAPAEILVVDDDEGVRELLRQTLEEAGHTVRAAPNGMEAVAMVRDRQPDLVILDVMMPGLSGYDVAAMLRADPRTKRLPIVILSVVSDRTRAESLGVDRYLSKPMQQDELLRTIDEVHEARADRTWVVMAYDEEEPS